MSPTAFRRQMRYLKDQGFTSIRLSDLVTSLKSNLALPGRAFVLTFDDGFKNVYQIAFPLLQELGFTATIFLVTDYIGQRASWELGERDRKAGVQHFPLLSWAEIKEMHRYGFTFGAHGAGHLPLTRLPARQVRSDVEKSKRIIEDELGTDCQLFCYPYGDYNQVVRGIVQETGFEGAVTTEFGRNGSGADLYALRRIGSAHFTTIPVFRACLYGTYGWHLRRRKTRFPQRG
ncbi:MAG: polysaccharide deacetylase family protein [Nitrospinota bacterium]|nr:MAG: polysaccharide deacetylase family protein [Nitrospinota bacterium]